MTIIFGAVLQSLPGGAWGSSPKTTQVAPDVMAPTQNQVFIFVGDATRSIETAEIVTNTLKVATMTPTVV